MKAGMDKVVTVCCLAMLLTWVSGAPTQLKSKPCATANHTATTEVTTVAPSESRPVSTTESRTTTAVTFPTWLIKDPTVFYPSSTLILLILREKCQKMKDEGVDPLPSYCWEALGSNLMSDQDLKSLYDSYSKSVSAVEKQNDLQQAMLTNAGDLV